MKQRENLNIAGEAVLEGGQYNEVRVTGHATFQSDLDAMNLVVTGEATFSGEIKTVRMSVSGDCAVEGGLDADTLMIKGRCVVDRPSRANQFTNSGYARFLRDLETDTIVSSGSLIVEGSLRARDFQCKGLLIVRKSLSAQLVDISLYGTSNVWEIHGDTVRIDHGKLVPLDRGMEDLLPLVHRKLESNLITGTDLFLEHAEVERVSGTNVYIGPKCRIGVVQVKGRLSTDPTSTVERVERL